MRYSSFLTDQRGQVHHTRPSTQRRLHRCRSHRSHDAPDGSCSGIILKPGHTATYNSKVYGVPRPCLATTHRRRWYYTVCDKGVRHIRVSTNAHTTAMLTAHEKNEVDREIVGIAVPTISTLAAEPLASLISTIFVGKFLGVNEIAGVGVALSLFNSFTKLFNMPLLAIVTNTIATAMGKELDDRNTTSLSGFMPPGAMWHSAGIAKAVMSGITLAIVIAGAQSVVFVSLGNVGLTLYGVCPGSDMFSCATTYLGVRVFGNVATVLFVSLMGIFRGLGDTVTPFVATLLSSVMNVGLEYVFLFQYATGVAGAAGAVVISQLASALALLFILSRRVDFEKSGGVQFAESKGILGSTGLLMIRTVSISATYAVATALVARAGVEFAAAHQILFQIWLASSLLADSLAVASQTLIARYLGQETDVGVRRSRYVAQRVLQWGLILGASLFSGLFLIYRFTPIMQVFTSSDQVLELLAMLFPVVIISQPLNAIAFVLDGIMYAMGSYVFASRAMVLASIPAIMLMAGGWVLYANSVLVSIDILRTVWVGLIVLMCVRIATIYVPYRYKIWPFDKLKDPFFNNSVLKQIK